MNVHRGDVVMVLFPLAGSSSTKRRPGVVVQNDRNNQRLENVILAQVTTRLGPPNQPSRFVVDPATPEGAPSGLEFKSAISCENLATVRKDQISEVIGYLCDQHIELLDRCLKASLGLT
jgi:mRNA-degrading endonuclease toxin of MazEF toxin-antitoxin module